MTLERLFRDGNKDKSILKEEKGKERKNSQGGKSETLPVNTHHRLLTDKTC